MKKPVYLIDRQSGRLVHFRKHHEREYSFTFLPRFDSERHARVTLQGVRHFDLVKVITLYSTLIIKVGVLASLGRKQELEDNVARLTEVSNAADVLVEA